MSGGILGNGAPQGTGLLGNMGNFLDENEGSMMGLGLGLMSGDMSTALQGYSTGNRQDALRRQHKLLQDQQAQKNAAAQSLVQKYNIPPEMATDADSVFAIVKEKVTQRPKEYGVEETYLRGLQKNDPAKFTQFMDSKYGPKPGTAPSGYAYGPDGKLAAIPGGPQDPDRDINEPLPGELAAKFGLARQYTDRFGNIEGDLMSKDPKSQGTFDQFGFGGSGAIQRDIALGSEAMVRMLTGAGKSEGEAKNEVKQYLPNWGDSPETILDKQYRLRASLRDMEREALVGRRSKRQIEAEYPRFEAPSYDDIVKRRKTALSGEPNKAPIGGASPAQATPRVVQHPNGATIERLSD